jgi:hypothetical protein
METKRLGQDPLEWIKDTRKETGGAEETKKLKQGRQSIHSIQKIPSRLVNPAKKGLRPGWSRYTLIMRDEHLEKVKALAYWDRKDIKEVVDEALGAYLKGRPFKPIPKKAIG